MPRLTRTLALAALTVVLTTGIAAAQQTPAPRPPVSVPAKPEPRGAQAKAEPSALDLTWDKTKAMTRKEWNVAKKKWATEKVKWQDCNRQADVEKLGAPKSWSFIANCMTRA